MSTIYLGMFLLLLCQSAVASDDDALELRKTGDEYRLRLRETSRELARVVPDAWQGNVRVLSPSGQECGVVWPHFLMNSEGNWLTDRVESEGMKLIEFEVLQDTGPVIGYRGQWKFRDYFTSSEMHFIWYRSAESTQVHLVKTRLQVLKDLEGINAIWVEFMTRENSYTTAAAMVKERKVITLDVSKTGLEQNMHYWDGQVLDEPGWISISGARNNQDASAALVPLNFSTGAVRPRINNGHVDNIEIHMLDASKRNNLTAGEEFHLEYLLFVGPDKKGWKWIDRAVKRARQKKVPQIFKAFKLE